MSAIPQTPAPSGVPTGHHDHDGHHDGHGHAPAFAPPPPALAYAGGPVVVGRWVLPTWTPPLLLALAGLAGCVLLRLWNPGDEGTVLCPFKGATGLDCPGCGMTRATYALTRGDLIASVDHNLFILPLAGVIAYTYVRWVGRRMSWWSLPELRFSNGAVWLTAVLLVAFWVARNLGPLSFFGSDAG